MNGAIQYVLPEQWLRYDRGQIFNELLEAKAAIQSLSAIPFQREWAEALQDMELKREVAGTSKIEGADFTEKEFEEAISGKIPPSDFTRSQKQARAAIQTYRWIASLPPGRPLDDELVFAIHRRIVTACDDDHCAPGQLRGAGENVGFGRPRHRGVDGGKECETAFKKLMNAVSGEFKQHDPLIQALALHYHIGAMHPFQDGNGRTARALEALILQRSQMKDSLFIAMSNYYYDEKENYLKALSDARLGEYNLTPFLKFGLHGIATQCKRLLREIRMHVERSLYRDVMGQMYNRLKSTRKRALAERQIKILSKLLDEKKAIEIKKFYDLLEKDYKNLKSPFKAYIRDLNQLIMLKAINVRKENGDDYYISVRLGWATEITETEFYKEINKLPEARTRLIITS